VTTGRGDSPAVKIADYLDPRTVTETADYLRHHLQAVGVERPVLAEAALAATYAWAPGLPTGWRKPAFPRPGMGENSL